MEAADELQIVPRDALKLRKSATGLGLFVDCERIAAGQRLMRYTGPLLNHAQQLRKGGRYLFEVRPDVFIDGSARANRARYFNHSCAPNAQARVEPGRDEVWIWSLRELRRGEEVCYDYGREYFEHFIGAQCRCAHCSEPQ